MRFAAPGGADGDRRAFARRQAFGLVRRLPCHRHPGHTPGHSSLLLENESIVITGDAMAQENGVPVTANPQFALDREEAEASLKKLLALRAKAHYCYHGGAYLPK